MHFQSAVPPMPVADRCLAFPDILAQELHAITGTTADPSSPALAFADLDVLEPVTLARRLTVGTDGVATLFRTRIVPDRVRAVDAILVELDQADGPAEHDRLVQALRVELAGTFNVLLERSFYAANQPCFAAVQLRSQTQDRIDDDDAPSRRMILEDAFPEVRRASDTELQALYRTIHARKFAALCLSGGGIRSATFALGVLQGLARCGLLDQFAYLSTVSGGGYIGGWLSAWINRTSERQVMQQLAGATARPGAPEPATVEYLRSYTNFLTPRLGLFAADTWTLIATWLRNLLLDWLVLIPVLAAVVTAPLVLIHVVSWQATDWGTPVQQWGAWIAAGVALAGSVMAIRYVHSNRPAAKSPGAGDEVIDEKGSQRQFLLLCLVPLVAAAFAAMLWWSWGHVDPATDTEHVGGVPRWLGFGIAGAAVHLGGWALSLLSDRARSGRQLIGRVFEPVFVAASGFAVGGLASTVMPMWEHVAAAPAVYVWFTVPMLLALVLIASNLYVGYSSNRRPDAEREWSARFTAWLLIVISVWVAGFGLVFLGPDLWAWLLVTLHADSHIIVKLLLGAVAGSSGVGAAVLGRSAATPATAGAASPGWRSWLGLALATIFVAWLVVMLYLACGALLAWSRHMLDPWFDTAWDGSGAGTLLEIGVLLVLFLFGDLSARCIDTNMFSLHAMYRARLIRAYLGASRPGDTRDPNRFTGFDDNDNLYLCKLAPIIRPDGTRTQPLHVINATLNLVSGAKLAWQERKAESFTFSPLHCGSAGVGYRATAPTPGASSDRGYGGSLGVTLGTAMAISGAAVSPDMGYHSSPVLSLLLTFFNVRLGWWLGNPGHAGRAVYTESAPTSALWPVVAEALGKTDDQNPWVYLSDGGHFENLGLYEMILRRCHTIVVSDASSDPLDQLGDLGNAIRKIRIDLGVPITMGGMLEMPSGNGHPAPRGGCCAVGTIEYSAVDGDASDGTLIYFKPALDATESIDVFNYSSGSDRFPHDSVADQWFSESQFESYRALGSHVIAQVLGDQPPTGGPTLDWLVERARTVTTR